MTATNLTVIQVLTITTVLYFVMVAFWILKMEDFLKTREEEYEEGTGEPIESTRDTEESAP